jgi:phage FluMu protein Com
MLQVEKGLALQEGDVVEFLRVYNPRTKQLNAVEIKKLKDAPTQLYGLSVLQKKFYSSAKSSADQKVVALRQPKSANWTQPFSAGRGKFLPEERNKLVAAFLLSSSNAASPSVASNIEDHKQDVV